MAKEIKEHKEIDYCIRGEGENNLPELIHSIESGNEESIERIKGVCYKGEEEISCNPLELITELDSIPFPNYDKFELNRYSSFPKHLYILTSRGCPFNCIYCSIGFIMGRKFRARSPKNVVDEIEHMSTKYGTSFFEFRDDNFAFDVKRAKQICERIISKDLNIKWCADIRVDRIDEELVGLMKESGCIRLDIGIESTNNEILRNLRRDMTREQIERGISLIKKHKIPIKGYFIIGFPEETCKDAISSLEFAIRKDLDEVSFYMLIPYPGT
ncbi:MAG TPA: radical SAM protein, partial [bacterium]|nr:radical SAM protein [bacterium]